MFNKELLNTTEKCILEIIDDFRFTLFEKLEFLDHYAPIIRRSFYVDMVERSVFIDNAIITFHGWDYEG